jgi:hypothetical protein
MCVKPALLQRTTRFSVYLSMTAPAPIEDVVSSVCRTWGRSRRSKPTNPATSTIFRLHGVAAWPYGAISHRCRVPPGNLDWLGPPLNSSGFPPGLLGGCGDQGASRKLPVQSIGRAGGRPSNSRERSSGGSSTAIEGAREWTARRSALWLSGWRPSWHSYGSWSPPSWRSNCSNASWDDALRVEVLVQLPDYPREAV